MVTTCRTGDRIAGVLREHVLTPLFTAEQTVEAEYDEVEAERRAFAQFKQRIAGIETASTSQRASVSTSHIYAAETTSRRVERVRSAFRETVMSVDHYGEMYDETLEEHAARELSAEVAAGLRREATTPFTDLYKTTLMTAVSSAIDQRETVCEHLDTELESLDTNREALTELLAACDGPSIPARDRREFESRLDEIARARQETIQRRDPSSRADGHDLCQYLYHDHEWTYPVLTAITRFRNAAA